MFMQRSNILHKCSGTSSNCKVCFGSWGVDSGAICNLNVIWYLTSTMCVRFLKPEAKFLNKKVQNDNKQELQFNAL